MRACVWGQRSGDTRADRLRKPVYLDALLLEHSTGSRWIKTKRPEFYGPLIVPTGRETHTRSVRFDEVGG